MTELEVLSKLSGEQYFISWEDIVKFLSEDIVVGKIVKLKQSKDNLYKYYAYNISSVAMNALHFLRGGRSVRILTRDKAISAILLSMAIMSDAGIPLLSIRKNMIDSDYSFREATETEIQYMNYDVITSYIMDKLETRPLSMFYEELKINFGILSLLQITYKEALEAIASIKFLRDILFMGESYNEK